MKWAAHRRWARKLGISDEVAREVDRIIDCSRPSELPAAYRDAVQEAAASLADSGGATHGNSALGLVIADDALTHDAGRRQTTRGALAATCILDYLQEKGDDYVQAWYLHHHLDYLQDRYTEGADIEALIDQYQAQYPQAYSPPIEEFLLDRKAMLVREFTE